jgi:hypothetical protein
MANKTWLSVAAAGVLAAGVFTGCGSSGNGNSSDTAAPTSFTLADGYVYNAKVTAYYQKDDNTTGSFIIPTTDYMHAVGDVKTQVQAGDINYKIAEADEAMAQKVKYIEATHKTVHATTAGTTPDTFIDENGDGKWDDNDTKVPSTFKMRAPYGFSVVSPVSDLIYANIVTAYPNYASKTKGFDLNETIKAQIDANTTLLATKLGLTAKDLKSNDPLTDVSNATNAKQAALYAMIASELGSATTDAKRADFVSKIQASTTPTTFQGVFEVLEDQATAAGTAGASVYANFSRAISDASSEEEFIGTIPKINLDETRNQGGLVVESDALSAVARLHTDLNVSNTLLSDLALDGAKIAYDQDLDSLAMRFATPDSNATAAFDLYVDLKSPKERVSDDNASSVQLTIKVSNLEVNATTAGVTLQATSTTRVAYEAFVYKASDSTDAKIISGSDLNISDDGGLNVNLITSNAIDLKALIGAVENNATRSGYDITDHANFDQQVGHAWNNLQNFKVGIADTDSSFAKVMKDSEGDLVSTYWPASMTISSAGGTIGNSALKPLIDLTHADMRNEVTASGANAAPANATSAITALSDDLNVTVATESDHNVTVTFTDANAQTSEDNTTVKLTVSSALVKLDKTSVTLGNGGASTTRDVNVTLDSSAIFAAAKGSHPSVDINWTTTDEFGKANTTKGGRTLVFNRPPTAFDTNSSWNLTYDFNITKSADTNLTVSNFSGSEFNKSSGVPELNASTLTNVWSFTDPDDNTETTATGLTITDAYCSVGSASINASGSEVDLTGDGNLTMAVTPTLVAFGFNNNATSDVVYPMDCNVSLRPTDSNGTYRTKDFNISITVPSTMTADS